MSETTFTPVPLVPDRRLMRTPTGPATQVRVLYVAALVRRAGVRTTRGIPSDNAVLAAYEALRNRGVSA